MQVAKSPRRSSQPVATLEYALDAGKNQNFNDEAQNVRRLLSDLKVDFERLTKGGKILDDLERRVQKHKLVPLRITVRMQYLLKAHQNDVAEYNRKKQEVERALYALTSGGTSRASHIFVK